MLTALVSLALKNCREEYRFIYSPQIWSNLLAFPFGILFFHAITAWAITRCYCIVLICKEYAMFNVSALLNSPQRGTAIKSAVEFPFGVTTYVPLTSLR
jgi:hypothetical protein